jgi:hypothetical protein
MRTLCKLGLARRSKLALGAVTTLLCLAACVGTASATRFSFTPSIFRIIWPNEGGLRFVDGAGVFAIECNVSMEGQFHSRVFSKVSGRLIGVIGVAQKFELEETVCRPPPGERFGNIWVLSGGEEQGEGFLPNSLPWHIRYDRFIGALPSITGVRMQIIGASFLLQGAFGIRCLYKSTNVRPLYVIAVRQANGKVELIRVDETEPIPLKEGAFCPANVTVSRTGNILTLTLNPIEIFLVT